MLFFIKLRVWFLLQELDCSYCHLISPICFISFNIILTQGHLFKVSIKLFDIELVSLNILVVVSVIMTVFPLKMLISLYLSIYLWYTITLLNCLLTLIFIGSQHTYTKWFWPTFHRLYLTFSSNEARTYRDVNTLVSLNNQINITIIARHGFWMLIEVSTLDNTTEWSPSWKAGPKKQWVLM